MNTSIAHKTSIQDKDNLIILIDNGCGTEKLFFIKRRDGFCPKKFGDSSKSISINQYNRWVFVQMLTDCRENARKAANSFVCNGCRK